MREFWEDLPDFPKYQVSNLGRVINKQTAKVLKPVDNGSKNLIVNLQTKSRPYIRQLRWLVAERFVVPFTDEGVIPQHINRDYTDCRAANLEWMYRSDVHWRDYQERQGLNPSERPIECLETGDIYPNVFECSKDLRTLARMLDRTTRNPRFTHQGYHFRYLED